MSIFLPLIIAGGGATLVLAKGEQVPENVKDRPATGSTVGARPTDAPATLQDASNSGAVVKPVGSPTGRVPKPAVARVLAHMGGISSPRGVHGTSSAPPSVRSSGGDLNDTAADVAIRQRTAEVEAEAKKQYDALSCDAKKAAGKVLAAKYGIVVIAIRRGMTC